MHSARSVQTPTIATVRLDAPNITRRNRRALAARLQDALRTSVHVIVDLSMVNYIDSSGLIALLRAAEAARAAGGDIKLAAPQDAVQSMLELTALFRFFDVHASLVSAHRASLARR